MKIRKKNAKMQSAQLLDRMAKENRFDCFTNSANRMFRLSCAAQNYAWGKLGSDSKVAQLSLNASAEKGSIKESEPYAELWMGTHVNGPSKIYSSGELLSDRIRKFPSRILSDKVAGDFQGELPFLFKVLSVNKALSIQAHPDKELAKVLHAKFPNAYKDDNHKPEMAIALTDFEALCGFREFHDILESIALFPELGELVGNDTVSVFKSNPSKETLKGMFGTLMRSKDENVKQAVDKAVQRLKASGKSFSKGSREELLVRLNSQYPGDVGCFCCLLLNYLCLKPSQAVFLGANEPHAYLSGDCIECMATSDNVVRAGLTPKLKDVETLLGMLTFKTYSASSLVLDGETLPTGVRLYRSPVPEFSVCRLEVLQGESIELSSVGPSILLVVEGSCDISSSTEEFKGQAGSVYFLSDKAKAKITSAKEKIVAYQAIVNSK
jgi:mannose-6-phosphate isomerase